ncbi:MAG: hypothetical protein II395_02835, partial [Ruminococcus sp.]|nr:hypothetical protein [Ruminococcus sp.]
MNKRLSHQNRDSLFHRKLSLFDPAVDDVLQTKKASQKADLGAASRCHAACLFVDPAVVAFGVLAVGDG